jgi:hypothetical protein
MFSQIKSSNRLFGLSVTAALVSSIVVVVTALAQAVERTQAFV